MSIEAILGLIATVGVPLGSALVVLAIKVARIEVKINTLWDFQIRRGRAELVEKGYGQMNSPIIIDERAMKSMEPMVKELRAFYERQGRHMSDRELIIEIERRWGDEITKRVCIPLGINEGACLIIAIETVRPSTKAA